MTRSIFMASLIALPSLVFAAELPDYCTPPLPDESENKICPPAITEGRWDMQPVSSVTAQATVNGLTAFKTEPMPGQKFTALVENWDCDTGEISVKIEQSGRTTLLKHSGTTADTANGTFTYEGKMTIPFATNVELRATDRYTAIYSLNVNDSGFGNAKGGVVMAMSIDETNALHPACNCRTKLQRHLKQRHDRYSKVLSGYRDTDLWAKPEGFDPNIIYDAVLYNQLMHMVYSWGLTKEQAVTCFNLKYDEVGPNDPNHLEDYFKRAGRAAATTDPETCEIEFKSSNLQGCYADVETAGQLAHEAVHSVECDELRTQHQGKPEDFRWLDAVKKFENPKPARHALKESKIWNDDVQALAETEIRAYTETLRFYSEWEAENCVIQFK